MRFVDFTKISKEVNRMSNHYRLSHTQWNCNTRACLRPSIEGKQCMKYRVKKKGQILRKICEWKSANLIEAEVCLNHMHVLLEFPPKMSVS